MKVDAMAVSSRYNFQTPASGDAEGSLEWHPLSLCIPSEEKQHPQWNTKHEADYHSDPRSHHARTRIFMRRKHLEDTHMLEQKIDGGICSVRRTLFVFFVCSVVGVLHFFISCRLPFYGIREPWFTNF